MADGARRARAVQGDGERLRDELIEAAATLLETGGPAAVTLRGVARAVGVAAPSIYLHFASRETLLVAALVHRFAQFGRSITSALTTARTPAGRLRAGCRAYCQFAIDRPAAYEVLFSGQAHRAVEALGDNVGLETFTPLVEAVSNAIDAGVARPGDPFAVARRTWTGLHGMSTLRTSLPDFPWNPLDEALDDLLHDVVGLDKQTNKRNVPNKR